jgi:glycosyltransferase involved in cell wall biosynthesis
MGPSLSVLIPARDAEPYVGAAIESVLAQGYEPTEVIVVDDGSTDGTADAARAAGAQVIGTPPRGIAHARNTLLEAAHGDLIAWLDADDTWLPDGLDFRVRHLIDHPELDFVLGRMQPFLEPGAQRPDWLQDEWLSGPLQGLLTTFVGWRRTFDVVGGFDPTFPVGEDTDWVARAAQADVRGARLTRVCARYRLHGANTTHHRNAEIKPLLMRTVRESLQRARAKAAS